MTRPAYRVLPAVTAESAAFWTGGAEGELRIYRCKSCQRYFHPPVGVCFRCHSRDVGPEAVSGRATVATYPVEDVRIGMQVEVEFERRDDVWIPVFRPVAVSPVAGGKA
jgi:uncharacterized OB-fold protein